MEFKDPWVLVSIPLVVGWLWLLLRRHQPTSHVFSSLTLLKGVSSSWKVQWAWVIHLLQIAIVVCLLIALAGPRRVLQETVVSGEGIDIVLAIDASGSMAAEDFTINNQRLNRLEVIKRVVADFIKSRASDQIGLVAFGARAYTICPLTLDHNWLLTNLERVKLGIIEDGTAIGSGISASLTRLNKSKAKSKVVILLTDGMNNAGQVDPLKAAQTAKALGIKIYTIGAGTKGLAPFPVTDMFGRHGYQQVQIDIDEQLLTRVGQLTGGQYFRATDTSSLQSIYRQIDTLEKSSIEQHGYKQYEQLFPYWLMAAFVLMALYILLTNTLFLKIP